MGFARPGCRISEGTITFDGVNLITASDEQKRAMWGSRIAYVAQSAAASFNPAHHLIDQTIETALQHNIMPRAEAEKLDRNPTVVQALEAARREALARLYIEQLVAKVPAPTDAEIQAFYDAKPVLFSARQIYRLQKTDIQVGRDRIQEIGAALQTTKSAPEVIAALKARNFAYKVSETNQPPEALGTLLDRLAALQPGQSVGVAQPFGVTVLTLLERAPSPLTLEQAKTGISQYLLNQKKRDAVIAESKSLRQAAKLEYLGNYAASAPQPAASPPAEAMPNLAPASAASN